MISNKEDNSNLYRVLERGDRRIEAAHTTAIMLVGLTRAGKSTTFNWILGRSMIGVGDQIEAHYENVINDANTAEVGDSFASVTLCPNIKELDQVNKISLIDMAGYKDKRNYIGVLGVSYFLKAVFQKVQKVKFLIVIEEHKLKQTAGDGVINTLNGFLNMFNLSAFKQEQRALFYSSISVMVTRAEVPEKHQAYLKRISNQIKDNKLNVSNKEELIRLIDMIISLNRLAAFPIAVSNQNPPKCDFLSRFDTMGWTYFNIPEIQNKLKAQVVALPFTSDFSELREDQRDLFNACIRARVDSYVDFSKIVGALVHSIKETWDQAVENFEINGTLVLNLGRSETLFQKVEAFLIENDSYNSQDFIVPEIRTQYKPLNFVGSIKQILKICDFIERINELQDNNFIQNMKTYSTLFEELIGYLRAFAGSQQEEHLLQRLAFVIKRGFREFSKLYQLNADIIHSVNQKMKDNCNNIFEEQRPELIQRFITKIDGKVLLALFPKIEELLEYEAFFNDYQNHFRGRHQPIFFSEHRFNLQSAKAKLGHDNSNKKEVLKSYISAFRNICEIAFSVNRREDNHDTLEEDLAQIELKKLTIIGNIVDILKRYDVIPSSKDYSLTISRHTKDFHEACEIFSIIIEESPLERKLEMLGEFAEYCLQWGNIEKAKELLHRKISLEKKNTINYAGTVKKLSIVIKDRARYIEKQEECISTWSRLSEDDPILNNILDELQVNLSNA